MISKQTTQHRMAEVGGRGQGRGGEGRFKDIGHFRDAQSLYFKTRVRLRYDYNVIISAKPFSQEVSRTRAHLGSRDF